MRVMKDSGVEWIGEIPEDWEIHRVKHAFTRKNEKALQEDPVILSLARAGVKVRDVSNNEGQVAESYYNYNPVAVDDLLLNPMDLYSGANCSISKVTGVISPAYMNLRYKKNICPTFYDYYFKSQYWMMAFFAYGKGVSYENRWTLTAETLMNYPIVSLPYTEQCIRADYLDDKCAKIDDIIAREQAVIEKLKAYKLSVITEAVTKGLDPDVPMKDSGIEWIGKCPLYVPISRVGLHYVIILGKMLCTKPIDESYLEQRYFCAANVHFDGIDSSELKTMWFSPKEIKQYQVKANDLLVVEGGAGAGGCAIVENISEVICVQNSIMIVRSKRKNSLRYLSYFVQMLTKQGYIDIVCNKATIPHYTKDKLSSTPFLLFPEIEQVAIADYLDSKCSKIDDAIDKKQAVIDKLTEYKKSLIYEVVTGKKEV